MAEVFLPDGAGSLSGVAHVIVRLPFVFGIIIRLLFGLPLGKFGFDP